MSGSHINQQEKYDKKKDTEYYKTARLMTRKPQQMVN